MRVEKDTMMTLRCQHSFHRECVQIWFGNDNHTCPLCRSCSRCGYTRLTKQDVTLFQEDTMNWVVGYGFDTDFVQFMVAFHPETFHLWVDINRWKEYNEKYKIFEPELVELEIDLQLSMSYVWRDFGETYRSC